MKRISPRIMAHVQQADPGGRHTALLFPWMHGRHAKSLRHDVSASEPEERKWAWIGAGLMAACAVCTLSIYSWLASLI